MLDENVEVWNNDVNFCDHIVLKKIFFPFSTMKRFVFKIDNFKQIKS